MKTVLLVAIFLLTLWTGAYSKALEKDESLVPRAYCYGYEPYCSCYDSGSSRILTCTINIAEDFNGLQRILRTDSYIDYYRVQLFLKLPLDIPADVLGGKRAQFLDIRYPETLNLNPVGQIDAEAFQSTSDYTTNVDLHNFDFTGFSFDLLLSQFPILTGLAIWTSSLKEFTDTPFLPKLTSVSIVETIGLESWYTPSQTPNLEEIDLVRNPDLNDQKLESILSSMTDGFIYPKLSSLSFSTNSLITRFPTLALSFPALSELILTDTNIVTLTTGSVNNKASSNLALIKLDSTGLETVQAGAFVGDFPSTVINLQSNYGMTSFPESAFKSVLESMFGHSGYVYLNPYSIDVDCGLAWLIRDNPHLIPYARGANFESLSPSAFDNC